MARNAEDIQQDIYQLKHVLKNIQDLQLIQDALNGVDVSGRLLGSEMVYRLDVRDGAWKEPQAEDFTKIRDRLVQFTPGGELDRLFARMLDAKTLGEAISQILLDTPINPRVLRGVPPEESLSFIRFLRDAKYRLLGPAKAGKEIEKIRQQFGNVEERLGELERELESARFGHSKEREMIAALKAGTLTDPRKDKPQQSGTAPAKPTDGLKQNPFAGLDKLLKK